MAKKCEICKKILLKNKNESSARFLKKRTCGTEHARQLLKKEGRGWYNHERKDELFIKYPSEAESLI